MCPSHRVVGTPPQSAEGGSSEAEFPPCRGPAEGSAEGASGESEIAYTSRGLGREPSSEAEIAPRLVRPRMDRTVALVRGPSVYFEILVPEENLGHMLGCVLRHYLGGVLVLG